jgi:hypothetical protein
MYIWFDICSWWDTYDACVINICSIWDTYDSCVISICSRWDTYDSCVINICSWLTTYDSCVISICSWSDTYDACVIHYWSLMYNTWVIRISSATIIDIFHSPHSCSRIYICIFVFTHTHTHTHPNMHTYMHIHIHICIYIYIHIYTYIYIYIYMHTLAQASVRACVGPSLRMLPHTQRMRPEMPRTSTHGIWRLFRTHAPPYATACAAHASWNAVNAAHASWNVDLTRQLTYPLIATSLPIPFFSFFFFFFSPSEIQVPVLRNRRLFGESLGAHLL